MVSPSTHLLNEKRFIPKCHWSNWSSWSGCTVTCGNSSGKRRRNRSKIGSKLCASTEEKEIKPCPSINNCPIDCVIGHWSEWTQCSQSCGTGSKSRKREIVRSPMFGGQKCSRNQDDYEETKKCVIGNCSVDGSWSGWSRWSYCDASCGNGKRSRKRHCDSPKPENGGSNCVVKYLYNTHNAMYQNRVTVLNINYYPIFSISAGHDITVENCTRGPVTCPPVRSI